MIRVFFSDRVGGRTLTLPLKTANGTDNFDLGGQWVGRLEVVFQVNVDLGASKVSGRKIIIPH